MDATWQDQRQQRLLIKNESYCCLDQWLSSEILSQPKWCDSHQSCGLLPVRETYRTHRLLFSAQHWANNNADKCSHIIHLACTIPCSSPTHCKQQHWWETQSVRVQCELSIHTLSTTCSNAFWQTRFYLVTMQWSYNTTECTAVVNGTYDDQKTC